MKFDWGILTERDYTLACQILGAGSRGSMEPLPDPDLVIAPDGTPYIYRWHLARTDLGGVYFHIQVADDPERPLHDHPWDNTSVILSGGYDEILNEEPDEITSNAETHIRVAGDVIHRKAEWAHRLLLPPGFRYTMTLFTFGPKRREWGFWTPTGWRRYTEMTEQLPDGRSVHKKPTMEG